MSETPQPEPILPNENSSLPQLRRELRSWTRDLAVALGLALVIIIFLYQPVKVEGTSMAPLLTDQERIFINKFVYRFEPIERGDVVVFWYPLDRSKSFIKRVIGLPGETIEIRGGRLYVNAKELGEPYVPAMYLDGSNYGPVQIPVGKLFCDGRPSRQFERFAGIWSGGAAVYLWQSGFCVLAGGSFRFADFFVHGKRGITMTKVGGHTDAAAGRARDSRAGRRKSI